MELHHILEHRLLHLVMDMVEQVVSKTQHKMVIQAVLVVVSLVVKEEVNLPMATGTPLQQLQLSDLLMLHNMVLDNQEATEGVEVVEASMVAPEEDHMGEQVVARASS